MVFLRFVLPGSGWSLAADDIWIKGDGEPVGDKVEYKNPGGGVSVNADRVYQWLTVPENPSTICKEQDGHLHCITDLREKEIGPNLVKRKRKLEIKKVGSNWRSLRKKFESGAVVQLS